MANRAALRFSAWLVALAWALPAAVSAEEAERARASEWVPALAALGDAFARSDQRGERADALVVVPVLVSVGADATAAAAGATAPGGAPAPALATRDETERWVPSFAFTSGIIGQNAEGAISSNSAITYTYFGQQAGPAPSVRFVSGRPELAPLTQALTRTLSEGKGEQLFRLPQSPALGSVAPSNKVALPTAGKDLFLTPTVGASLELMTPGLQSVPLKPRLFLHGDASLAFAFNRAVAKEGVPEGVKIPLVPDGPGSTTLWIGPTTNEKQVQGVGSKTEGQVQTLVFSGGMGSALTLHLWERPFRIKPSFEFLRQDVEVSGRLTRAFRKDTGIAGQTVPGNPPLVIAAAPAAFVTPIDLEASDTETFYGIGPGLELEMDAARAGPVMLTVFVSGQAYRMLGNRDVQLTASQTITDPAIIAAPGDPANQATVSAKFDFSLHSWAYRSGVGLRFRWLPED